MEDEHLHFISLLVAGISGFLLFWRGQRLGMIRRYPLVYAFIAVTLLVAGVGEVLSAQLKVDSRVYVLLYAWLLLVHAAAGIAVLLGIYYLRRKPSLIDLHFLVFLGLILTRPFFWTDGIWLSYRVLTAVQLLQTCLGMSAFARLFFGGRMLPGWNLPMVVVAITFPSVFHSLILAQYLFGVNAFSYAAWNMAMELATIGSWVILVVGLWEYSPPMPSKLSPRPRAELKARIWANIKTLWGLR